MITFTIMVTENSLKTAELYGSTTVLEHKVKNMTDEVMEISRELKKLETNELETKNDEREFESKSLKLKQREKDFIEQHATLEEQLNDAKKELIINDTSLNNLMGLMYVFFYFILYFILQSAFGFILWYHKLQKHQDEILRMEAESKKRIYEKEA